VYSFAIVCYEIATRQYPFDEYNNDPRFCVVINRGGGGGGGGGGSDESSIVDSPDVTSSPRPVPDGGAEATTAGDSHEEATAPATELSTHKIKHAIIYQDLRPSLPPPSEQCPAWFGELISKCWSTDPRQRPTFYQILEIFERELGEQYSLQMAVAQAPTRITPEFMAINEPIPAAVAAAAAAAAAAASGTTTPQEELSLLDQLANEALLGTDDDASDLSPTCITSLPTAGAGESESLMTSSLASVPASLDVAPSWISRSLLHANAFNQSFSSLSPMLSSTPYMPSISLRLEADSQQQQQQQNMDESNESSESVKFSNEASLVATTAPVIESVVTAVARARDQIWVAWKNNVITVLSAQVCHE
jgi:serine/threonine protein kinase